MGAKRMVFVETREVGQGFGCVGVVRDSRTGRKLAESETVRPHGFVACAAEDAVAVARTRGWEVDFAPGSDS